MGQRKVDWKEVVVGAEAHNTHTHTHSQMAMSAVCSSVARKVPRTLVETLLALLRCLVRASVVKWHFDFLNQARSKQILVGQAIFKGCWEVGGLTLGGQSPPYLGGSGGMLPRENF